MKNYLLTTGSLLLLLIGVVGFVTLPQEDAVAFKKVKAIKLTEMSFKALKANKVLPEAIKVDKNRILTATEGYKLLVDEVQKRFSIIPESQAQPMTSPPKGIQAKKLDGIGTLWCHCGGGTGDNCKFVDKGTSGGVSSLGCEGGCSCGMEITSGGPPFGTIVEQIYP